MKLVVPEQEHVPPLSLNHVTSVTPTASLAVPVTLNESLVVEDGSEVEIVVVGAVVSHPPELYSYAPISTVLFCGLLIPIMSRVTIELVLYPESFNGLPD